MRNVAEAAVRVGGGIEGDSHVGRSKRAVTVVDRSTHDAVGVRPGDLREQITVEGMPTLGSLAEGALLRIGTITLRVNGSCDPCTHIGEMNGIADPDEFQSMLEGRRGLVCNVLSADGPVRVGDEVSVMETADSR
jgi:MOSC domain-containing protein YiiM